MFIRGRLAVSLIMCVSSACGCSDDEREDLGSAQPEDGVATDAVTHDNDATREPVDSQPDDTFSFERYYEILCNYYTSCSPELRAAYGSRERCLDFSVNAAQVVSSAAPDLFSGPGWDRECLADLAGVDCPPRQPGVEHTWIVQQHLFGALLACGRPEAMPCNDAEDCLELWECSTDDGTCGSCQPAPPGACRSLIQCSSGETCVDDVCVPTKPIGSACESFLECASSRCTDVCVESLLAGDMCANDIDCGNYLWCDDGVCALPGAPGERCGADLTTQGCQLGYICREGICTEVGYRDVPVGGLCLFLNSCVAGAECTGGVCVQSELACTADNHCPQGHYCEGECLPHRADNEVCDADRQCASGYCSDDNTCEDPNPCD